MLMKISVRDLQNYIIKPSDNGGLDIVVDSVTQTILISDKTLRSFILPQVRKITFRLHQIYGCELFIIPKCMQLDLNIFRKRLVKYLKQNFFSRHTPNRQVPYFRGRFCPIFIQENVSY